MLGVGLEYALNCHWSLKAEYKHYFFGNESISAENVEFGEGTTTETKIFHTDADMDSVQLGVNYKF